MHIYEGHEVKNSSVVLLGDYRTLEKERGQLEADKLEAYRAIVDNHVEYGDIADYCIQCEGSNKETGNCTPIVHSEDCIVLKAEKYIREVEN